MKMGIGWESSRLLLKQAMSIEITTELDTFTRTVEALSIPEITSFDPETGALTVTGIPGEKFYIEVYENSRSVMVKCGYSYQCSGFTIPENGIFTVNIGPVSPGQGVDLVKMLQDGRIIGRIVFNEPAINAFPQYDQVNFDVGNWGGAPIVILKDSLGGVKQSLTASMSYYNYTYYAQFSVDMVPGDKIEITNGYQTDVMTVGDLSNLRLNYNTKILTGQGTGDKVSTRISGFDIYYCFDHPLEGATDFSIPIPVVKADTQAYVELYGADGNVTSIYAYALDLNVWVNNSSLRGYTETPGVTVNWELSRNGTKYDEGSTLTEGMSTYFYTWYNVTPQTGDMLVVTTSDGNSASIVYPTLTASADFTDRTISGKSIPNRWGWINFYRHTPDYYFSYNLSNLADSTGSYLVHMPQEMYWDTDCTPINADYPCGTLGNYSWDAENFWIINWPGWPDSIAADAYETDDSKENASSISSPQSHTVHTYYDEDWVKFTVSQEDVDHGHVYLLKTYGLGLDFNLVMELRAPDGVTILDNYEGENWDGSGLGPEMQHIFTEPGTYYLRLHSMGSDWDGGYCDSHYNLLVIKDPKYVFLPLIKR